MAHCGAMVGTGQHDGEVSRGCGSIGSRGAQSTLTCSLKQLSLAALSGALRTRRAAAAARGAGQHDAGCAGGQSSRAGQVRATQQACPLAHPIPTGRSQMMVAIVCSGSWRRAGGSGAQLGYQALRPRGTGMALAPSPPPPCLHALGCCDAVGNARQPDVDQLRPGRHHLPLVACKGAVTAGVDVRHGRWAAAAQDAPGWLPLRHACSPHAAGKDKQKGAGANAPSRWSTAS